MALGLAFDVYGTLVDPLRMSEQVRDVAGDLAERFAQVWREKQLEYSWRHTIMDRYVPFDECAREGLRYAARSLNLRLSGEQETGLLAKLQWLEPYPDALPAIDAVRAAGHRAYAFSNGTHAMVRELLENGGLLSHLDGVISVDDVKMFKPHPAAYAHCVATLGVSADRCWLVSSNPFDCIGAKAAGMHCAWVKRRSLAVFDTWGGEPDATMESLAQLAQLLPAA